MAAVSGGPLRSCPACGHRDLAVEICAHVTNAHQDLPGWVAEAAAGGCSVYVAEEIQMFVDACGGLAVPEDLVLVVDNERVFPWPAVYARSSAEAICALAAVRDAGGAFKAVWLDYDMGPDRLGGEDTGARVAAWMAGRGTKSTPVVVHTSNRDGAAHVTAMLEAAGFRVSRQDAESAGATGPPPEGLPMGLYPPAHA